MESFSSPNQHDILSVQRLDNVNIYCLADKHEIF